MTNGSTDEINVLKLTLHGRLVGYLAGFHNGRNVLSFADEFKADAGRTTFSLITHPSFPHSDRLMAEPWARNQRLHPTLSNLLPEGSLRELIAQGLKVHVDNEFHILSYLGEDLPGALVAEPMEPDDVPDSVLTTHGKAKAVKFEKVTQENKFSLAGVQMKFSMKEKDGRYNLSKGDVLGDWIIKTPSTQHKDVPVNEYTAMTLASLVGIDIPEIKLVELNKLDNLPQINLPDEKLAFAIKRFDRDDDRRIHMEDFAQVLVKYPHEKYNSANYEQIGRILYGFSGDGLTDAQQFARRLLVNILLANGDAHLKNWSLLYSDQITPRLSPAYDIVTTSVYIDNERHYALNLGKTKDWYEASYANFQSWAVLNDNLGGDFYEFLKAALSNLLNVTKGACYVAMSSSELDTLQKAFRDAGGKWSTFIVWAKNTFTLGRSDYQRQYEPILYGWREGSEHYWCGARDQGDVWFFNKPVKNDLHPTMKPVELVERAIRNSSKSRDIVLDLFGGSGSTLIACEKTGRSARLIELDPKYVDVIIRRWQDYTGKQATRVEGGVAFDELALNAQFEEAVNS